MGSRFRKWHTSREFRCGARQNRTHSWGTTRRGNQSCMQRQADSDSVLHFLSRDLSSSTQIFKKKKHTNKKNPNKISICLQQIEKMERGNQLPSCVLLREKESKAKTPVLPPTSASRGAEASVFLLNVLSLRDISALK